MSDKHPGGRPTKYNAELHPKLVEALAKLGHTDTEIAEHMSISVATLYNWQNEHHEFLEASKKGKAQIDAQVENALLQRALGYEHEEDKIFNNNGSIIVQPTVKHYPPETLAIKYWLNNRQPEKWRERKEHVAKIVHKYDDMSDEELDAEIIALEEDE